MCSNIRPRTIARAILILYFICLPPLAYCGYLFFTNTVADFSAPKGTLVDRAMETAQRFLPDSTLRDPAFLLLSRKDGGLVVNPGVTNQSSDICQLLSYVAFVGETTPTLHDGGYISSDGYCKYLKYPMIGNEYISLDKKKTLIVINMVKTSAKRSSWPLFESKIRSWLNVNGTALQVEITSQGMILDETEESVIGDIVKIDSIAIPFAMLTLAFCLRSFRMLIIAAAVLVVTLSYMFGILYPISTAIEISSFAPECSSAVTTALCIDYALFFCSRFSERTRIAILDGRDISDEAEQYKIVKETTTLVAHNIIVSGTAIAISLAGLMLIPLKLISTIGIAFFIGTMCAVFVGMTLQPAIMLAFFEYFSHDEGFACLFKNVPFLAKIFADDMQDSDDNPAGALLEQRQQRLETEEDEDAEELGLESGTNIQNNNVNNNSTTTSSATNTNKKSEQKTLTTDSIAAALGNQHNNNNNNDNTATEYQPADVMIPPESSETTTTTTSCSNSTTPRKQQHQQEEDNNIPAVSVTNASITASSTTTSASASSKKRQQHHHHHNNKKTALEDSLIKQEGDENENDDTTITAGQDNNNVDAMNDSLSDVHHDHAAHLQVPSTSTSHHHPATISPTTTSLSAASYEEHLSPSTARRHQIARRAQYKSFWYKVGTFAVERSCLVILVTLVLIIPFLVAVGMLEISFDLFAQVPRDSHRAEVLDEILKEIGTGSISAPFFITIDTHRPFGLGTPFTGNITLPLGIQTIVEVLPLSNKTGGFNETVFQVLQQFVVYVAGRTRIDLERITGYVSFPGAGIGFLSFEANALIGCAQIPADSAQMKIIESDPRYHKLMQGCKEYYALVNRTVDPTYQFGFLIVAPPFDTFGPKSNEFLTKLNLAISEFDTRNLFSVGFYGASSIDWQVLNSMIAVLPIQVGSTLGVIFLIIGVVFRSVVVPLRMLLTMMITIVFSFGFTTFLFQTKGVRWIWGENAPNAFCWLIPIFAFSLMCSLAIDYDVFVITRIVELKKLGFSDAAATKKAVWRTGRVISAAGLIMIISFGSLLFSKTTMLKQFGVCMMVACLIDCFFIRTLVTPAMMNFRLPDNLCWYPLRFNEDAGRDEDDMTESQQED